MAGLLKKPIDPNADPSAAPDPNAAPDPSADPNADASADQAGTSPDQASDPNADDAPATAGQPTPPRQESGADEGEQATPEEQAQYEELFKNGWRMIADPQGKVVPAILQSLDNDPQDLQQKLGKDASADLMDHFSPAKALAGTIVTIMLALATKAQQAGVKLFPSSMMQAGRDLMSDLSDLAAKNKIHTFTDDELKQAAIFAAGMYGKAARESGLITPDDVQQDVGDMKQLDSSGQLAQAMKAPPGKPVQTGLGQDQPDANNGQAQGLPQVGGQ